MTWTGSSDIPLQAYRTDMVAEALAVRCGGGGGGGGGGAGSGVPREGLHGLLSLDRVQQRFVDLILLVVDAEQLSDLQSRKIWTVRVQARPVTTGSQVRTTRASRVC